MSNANAKSKNDTTLQTPAQILNQSFDQTYQVLATESLVHNPITGALDRAVQPGNEIPTSGINPSLTITKTIASPLITTVIAKVIGSTTYTKTIVKNTTTNVETVSAWS